MQIIDRQSIRIIIAYHPEDVSLGPKLVASVSGRRVSSLPVLVGWSAIRRAETFCRSRPRHTERVGCCATTGYREFHYRRTWTTFRKAASDNGGTFYRTRQVEDIPCLSQWREQHGPMVRRIPRSLDCQLRPRFLRICNYLT